ncbi:MAG: DUF2442 domain-containing protein [Chloroflexi bacterium]|nr:DUF2442 domain-containing protein [Chloroflexota bacterium]
MSSLAIEIRTATVQRVRVTKDTLVVDLTDGRTISAPLAWYPRLVHGSPVERNNWRLIGGGVGIHWPNLDEDISVENLILGKPSGESQRSLKQWLEARAARRAQVPKKHTSTHSPTSLQRHPDRGRGQSARRPSARP